MADKKEKRTSLPWGMDMERLQPNSVKVTDRYPTEDFAH